MPARFRPLAQSAYLKLGPATSRWRMEPSFLVIGGQRCGTTTIFKKLAEHPQVIRPPAEKGTDYYTLYYDHGFDWYRGHFPLTASSQMRGRGNGKAVAFEACTYYMFHPFAIERIAHDFPNIKLVAMLRDPVERAYSAYKHELARGFETEPNFMKALELEDDRLDGEIERIAADPAYESHAHRHQAYRRRGQYVEQLERVLEHFPRTQLHVMESESFFADPAREYANLLEFLQLEINLPKTFEQFNARPGNQMPRAAHEYLTHHYQQYDERLSDVIGRRPSWTR